MEVNRRVRRERMNAFPTHTLEHVPLDEPTKHQLIVLLSETDKHITKSPCLVAGGGFKD